MGFMDNIKGKVSDAVDDHGDKIADGIDKAAGVADEQDRRQARRQDRQGDRQGQGCARQARRQGRRHQVTQPVPEETNEAYDLDEAPPGEHDSEATGAGDGDQASEAAQEENAETSLDQPST